jgi:ketosteroid isomerase-like protein
MRKFAVLLALGLALAPSWEAQTQEMQWRQACIQRCVNQPMLGDPEMQRQEIVSLEREAAHAIQQSNGTFFQRVYSDEYAGTLTHGQQVNKAQWIQVIESADVKRESFHASDIKVRVLLDTAVATCLWSTRFTVNGRPFSAQIRATHVYINTPRGWHVISGQATNLPPDVQQPI